MRLCRGTIREFILKADWATASNVCYLLAGKCEKRHYAVVAAELNSMCKTKRKSIRLKKLNHDFYTPYALAESSRHSISRQHAEHDIKLRDCLGKYLYVCGYGLMEYLTIRTFADAKLTPNTGNLYFEFDNGHMTRTQLIEKIRNHYRVKGAYRVVFWMASAEYSHYKHSQRINSLEQKRLNMLFDIIKETLKDKPNRILGACYHQYLLDGKVYNYREEMK
jgi:hypothetical protein